MTHFKVVDFFVDYLSRCFVFFFLIDAPPPDISLFPLPAPLPISRKSKAPPRQRPARRGLGGALVSGRSAQGACRRQRRARPPPGAPGAASRQPPRRSARALA